MKRRAFWLLAILAIFALCAVAIGWWRQLPPRAPLVAVPAPVTDAATLERGRYLVRAGDCIACHTARGGVPYAGGRAVATPFGAIYASNLTPDVETGLGGWSADDFWAALHEGRSRTRGLLYPAFPYTNYTRVTRADADAMFAYLRALPPVRQAVPEPELRFPFGQRPLLAAWRALYFRPGVFVPEPRESEAWNRGAYLVEGLGHCDACHSQRNALGAIDKETDLRGGIMPALGWYAPPLIGTPQAGVAEVSAEELAQLLATGVSQRAAATGPMAEVVFHSLQYLTDADIAAMVEYLRARSVAERASVAPMPPKPAPATQLTLGADIYRRHCQDCHGENGEGAPPAYPSLVGNPSVLGDSAVNPIRLVADGGFPPGTRGNPRPYGMPPYRQTLSEAEIAAVLSYIRGSWGNQARPVAAHEVSRYSVAPQW